MSSITYKKLAELIRSCTFLPAEIVNKWEKKLPDIPESFYPLFWRTFEDVKKTMSALYIEFELSRDSSNKYREQIQNQSLRAVKLVKSSKLNKLRDSIDCKKTQKMV